jgi:hypothetical protein
MHDNRDTAYRVNLVDLGSSLLGCPVLYLNFGIAVGEGKESS